MGKICLSCGEHFIACASRPDQQYCGKAGCQRERRRRYHRKKMETDPVYRHGQLDCQRNWREQNKEYWRQYRAKHREYVAENRRLQQERNRRRGRPADDVIAKMDELTTGNHIKTGLYRLVPVGEGVIAKMNELIVQLAIIPEQSVVGIGAGP